MLAPFVLKAAMGEYNDKAGEAGSRADSDLRILVDQLTQQNASLRVTVCTLRDAIDVLKAQLHEYRRTIFGSKSEKPGVVPDFPLQRLLLFPDLLEAQHKQEQQLADLEAAKKEQQDGSSRDSTSGGRGSKSHGRRDSFPDHLPRKTTEHRLPEEERSCCGAPMRPFGTQKTEVLGRIETCYVHEHLREKCVCDHCNVIKIADAEIDRMNDRDLLGTDFVAQVINDRFLGHLPYARLERKLSDEGIDVSRSLLCETVLRAADILEPVYVAVRDDVLSAELVQADDTEILQRNGNKKGKKKVNLWVYRSDERGAFFEITTSRSRDGPKQTLKNYFGRLQTDGHLCFKNLSDAIIGVGCWSHARRYFYNAALSGDELSQLGLSWINAAFKIEKEIRTQDLGTSKDDCQKRKEIRQRHSKPLMDELFAWAESLKSYPPRSPRSKLMKAVNYLLHQRVELLRFLEDGRITDITNNASERALRGPVCGRKNWLFFGNEEGGRRSAILLSLMQTCRELGVNPKIYIADVLRRVATTPATQVDSLIPRHWKSRFYEAARERYERDAKLFASAGVAAAS